MTVHVPEFPAVHRELTERGVTIEAAQLGSDVFNELSLREPGGTLLRVLEARSFSPPELPASTRLGIFRSLSLPCRDLNRAADFWLKLQMLYDLRLAEQGLMNKLASLPKRPQSAPATR